jgi:hypothetical protein
VKVVQELMRHASSRFTLEVYTQAKARAKRDAQQRIVEMMLPEEGLVPLPWYPLGTKLRLIDVLQDPKRIDQKQFPRRVQSDTSWQSIE